MAYHGDHEVETAREATPDESAVILAAVQQWRAGKWKPRIFRSPN